MESTIDTFKRQQSQTISLLEKMQKFIEHGEDAGLTIEEKIKDKLRHAINSVANEKLKVALIGGFSEGKTSIVAAWMENLDKSSMKISHQESSNEVKIYDVGEDFVLIDTPGLFGFKEQENAETHAIEKYKEITKKYISEAHLVLYVMNSTNPIKESHKDDLKWLFRTLDLLPRTVFVLSRFDEVADLEDEEDCQYHLQIKRDNVTSRLREMIGLSEREIEGLSVVAVAANPFDLGMDHWLANIQEFKTLSHIATLQLATTEKIRENGGDNALVNEMRTSVIRDILNNQLPVAIEIDIKISLEVAKLSELNANLTTKLSAIGMQIEDARNDLREFAMRYFTDLIMQAKGCSIETFNDFFEREVGSDGIILATRLQMEFSRQTQHINLEVEAMKISFDSEINHFNTTVRAMGKQGIKYLTKGNFINKTTVLAARDGIVSAAKTIGVDIGKYLKFKPWGATKFANGASGALAVLGLAIEAWDSWDQHKREQAFREAISNMVSNFEKQRKDFIDLINSEQFKENFFSNYITLKNDMEIQESILNERREYQQRFQSWRKEAEIIDAEFKDLIG